MKAGDFMVAGLLRTALAVLIIVAVTTTNTPSCLARSLRGRSEVKGGLKYGVSLHLRGKQVVMDNGILQVTVAVPQGYITAISFNGLHNLLQTHNKRSNRGYWDINWQAPGRCDEGDCTDGLIGTSFKIINQSKNQTEISFSSRWDPKMWNSSEDNPTLPINIDRRYIMLRGLSGFYSYAILEREEGWPANIVYQIRAVYKLQQDLFHYMAISDERQRVMPMPEDRDKGEPLAYKEAVLLTDPTNIHLKGEVDDKYQYSCEDQENRVHGWISSDPSVGFWMITPTNEFRSAGPFKQDLTSHTGPITLAMFHSTHYAGTDVAMTFSEGESWKKVFGPFFIYLNKAPADQDYHVLWEDAKRQRMEEYRKWPYEFPASEDFPKSRQRGSVSGRLLVKDSYVNNSLISASFGWVGLAAQGEVGSWQREAKGYQFWTRADLNGNFIIKGVRRGNYSLYASVNGFIGDYKYESDIHILPGNAMKFGDLIYEPLRNGPTLWEIGIPDRSAAEFYIPDPRPGLLNKLYVHKIHERFRQYGLWERYTDLYPKHDLVYTVGSSDYRKDWFFAQVTREAENKTYKPTTWQILFPLANVDLSSNYTLRLAVAAAEEAEVQVRFNDPGLVIPHFTTMRIGRDNAIARHGIHGLYRLFNVGVLPSWLRSGQNTLYLTQPRNQSAFHGVMYDYIRLEGPLGRFKHLHKLRVKFAATNGSTPLDQTVGFD